MMRKDIRLIFFLSVHQDGKVWCLMAASLDSKPLLQTPGIAQVRMDLNRLLAMMMLYWTQPFGF